MTLSGQAHAAYLTLFSDLCSTRALADTYPPPACTYLDPSAHSPGCSCSSVWMDACLAQVHGSLLFAPSSLLDQEKSLPLLPKLKITTSYFLNMASSFFLFLPFRQNPATMDTTLQPTQPLTRIIASGRCAAVVAVAGTLKVSCPCPRGNFVAPFATLEVECKLCAHPFSQHKGVSSIVGLADDVSSTLVSGSFLPSQGIASFISSLHSSPVFRSS